MSFLHKSTIMAAMALVPMAIYAGNVQRGLGWQGGSNDVNAHHAELLAPGVDWIYNWGPDTSHPEIYNEDFYFVPMAWNGSFNESRIRTWLQNHPETKYLLGFNEPNFADQAAMTPAAAAAKWPVLEKIANDFGVQLVGPAMNFSPSQVGGKVWGIYEWLDEFFRLVPNAKVDCLAAHCYMNWYTANTWFATEYFYKDIFSADNTSAYPNLVKFLNDSKAKNGHYPKMMLTEFCSWEYDVPVTVDFQIDQMTQKVQKLEQSDVVEGYAWFMGNAGGGAGSFPYMSVLQSNTATSGLSELGKVYVHMSKFDTDRYYKPGETIMAKDYVTATTDDAQVKLRSNSEAGSSIPLQIEIPKSGFPTYQIDVPADGSYKFVYRIKSNAATSLQLYVGSKKNVQASIPNSSGSWMDVEIDADLTAGKHKIMLYNTGSASVFMNSFKFGDDSQSGIGAIETDAVANDKTEIFTINGLRCNDMAAPGLYIVRQGNKTSKVLVK